MWIIPVFNTQFTLHSPVYLMILQGFTYLFPFRGVFLPDNIVQLLNILRLFPYTLQVYFAS